MIQVRVTYIVISINLPINPDKKVFNRISCAKMAAPKGYFINKFLFIDRRSAGNFEIFFSDFRHISEISITDVKITQSKSVQIIHLKIQSKIEK